MAAQPFQYIKLPDGRYGKFDAAATDDAIRTQVMKDYPDAFPAAKPSSAATNYDTYMGSGAARKLVRPPMQSGKGFSERVSDRIQNNVELPIRAIDALDKGPGVQAKVAQGADLDPYEQRMALDMQGAKANNSHLLGENTFGKSPMGRVAGATTIGPRMAISLLKQYKSDPASAIGDAVMASPELGEMDSSPRLARSAPPPTPESTQFAPRVPPTRGRSSPAGAGGGGAEFASDIIGLAQPKWMKAMGLVKKWMGKGGGVEAEPEAAAAPSYNTPKAEWGKPGYYGNAAPTTPSVRGAPAYQGKSTAGTPIPSVLDSQNPVKGSTRTTYPEPPTPPVARPPRPEPAWKRLTKGESNSGGAGPETGGESVVQSPFDAPQYRNASKVLTRGNQGGANYSADDLIAFKKKNGVTDIPAETPSHQPGETATSTAAEIKRLDKDGGQLGQPPATAKLQKFPMTGVKAVGEINPHPRQYYPDNPDAVTDEDVNVAARLKKKDNLTPSQGRDKIESGATMQRKPDSPFGGTSDENSMQDPTGNTARGHVGVPGDDDVRQSIVHHYGQEVLAEMDRRVIKAHDQGTDIGNMKDVLDSVITDMGGMKKIKGGVRQAKQQEAAERISKIGTKHTNPDGTTVEYKMDGSEVHTYRTKDGSIGSVTYSPSAEVTKILKKRTVQGQGATTRLRKK